MCIRHYASEYPDRYKREPDVDPAFRGAKPAESAGRGSMDADCLDWVPDSTPLHHETVGKLLNCSVQGLLLCQGAGGNSTDTIALG